MEATFVGRLGQKMHLNGTPTEVATAYAFLMAADVQSIRAMDQARLNEEERDEPKPKPKNGGYSEPPFDLLRGGTDEIINNLLDWVIDQRKKEDGDGDGDGDK